MKKVKNNYLLIVILLFLTACTIDKENNIEHEDELISELEDTVYNYKKENNDIIMLDKIVTFPEPSGLIQVQIDTLGKELPESKDEGDLPVIFTFTAGGASVNTYGAIKVQGSSTAKWPKKNWTLKFYANEARTERLRVKIGDSVPAKKWIAKAEWLDPTLLRNSVSFKLWESMVQSRDEFPQYEVDNAWLGNNNMVDGIQTGAKGFPPSHPIHVEVNDRHYGISMLILGHEPDNFNINKDNPKHVYMEFDARGGEDSTKSWEKFSIDGVGRWINSYHPEDNEFTENQLAAIGALSEVINGTQDNFEEKFTKHFDKSNMIDYLLFLEMIYDWDATAQDAEMITYDLEKWYILPWDKDTTFGMFWDESGIIEGSATKLLIDYESEHVTQKPWYKTYHAFTPEVEARYAQLRDENIFSVQNLHELTGEITKKIPKEIWQAEQHRWEEESRPSLDETSTSQIISWFEERLEMLDKHFNYK